MGQFMNTLPSLNCDPIFLVYIFLTFPIFHFHFLFILCSIFFWGRLRTLPCVFISPSHAWFHVLLVAGTQNMIVDLFMDVY